MCACDVSYLRISKLKRVSFVCLFVCLFVCSLSQRKITCTDSLFLTTQQQCSGRTKCIISADSAFLPFCSYRKASMVSLEFKCVPGRQMNESLFHSSFSSVDQLSCLCCVLIRLHAIRYSHRHMPRKAAERNVRHHSERHGCQPQCALLVRSQLLNQVHAKRRHDDDETLSRLLDHS